jgi:hypothetical protein
VMDTLFRDDECRIRTDHAPANFTTLRHIAHNLIRSSRQRQLASQTQGRRMGLPCKSNRRMIFSPDSPGPATRGGEPMQRSRSGPACGWPTRTIGSAGPGRPPRPW